MSRTYPHHELRFAMISRMVRFLVAYDKPTDPAEFDRHYYEVHVPLAKKLPGLRRYTISRHVRAARAGETTFYLVAELDWDDLEALEAAFTSPEGQATAEDAAQLRSNGTRSMIFDIHEL